MLGPEKIISKMRILQRLRLHSVLRENLTLKISNINKSLIFDTLWVLGLIPYTQNFPLLGLLLLIFSKNCF